MSVSYNKPLPSVKPWTEKFWKGAREGKLFIQKGKKSGKFIMYPKKYSPYDYTEEIEWVEASGKGTIYTYTVVRANPPSAFFGELPYCVAVVELDEGVRMCTNIVDTDFDKIHIGASVSAVFEPVTEEIGLVKFRMD